MGDHFRELLRNAQRSDRDGRLRTTVQTRAKHRISKLTGRFEALNEFAGR